MLAFRLLLSRATWKKDGDDWGEENGMDGRLGETEGRGGKWRTVEEKEGQDHGRIVGGHSTVEEQRRVMGEGAQV